MRKNYLISILFLSIYTLCNAAEPIGYYDIAIGKTEAALKTQLGAIVGPHTERTYANLWTDFQTTDKRADGKVWDMYSTCSFTFVTDQDKGSGGSAECQFYNREHSFPKSWFNDATPMYTDLFHLYPTDKYVNNQRNNYPYGETESPTSTYSNGSKLGSSTFSGYSGIVFEPIDEYKGDFARTYFYMVTAYDDKVANWNSEHLNKTKYPAFNTWTIELLLKWNRLDPVSEKETNRNNAVEAVQKNRNPFIDYPDLAEYIWGTKMGEPWSHSSGIENLAIKFSISPNPVQNRLNIETNESNLTYIIYNLSGLAMAEDVLNVFSNSIDVSQFDNGMYLISLKSATSRSIQKFIINK